MAEEQSIVQTGVLDEHEDQEKGDAGPLMEQMVEPPVRESNGDGADAGAESCRKLFVGGLNRGTTDDGLRDYFSQFGEIDSCIIKCDPTTNRSRGFGFVTFKDKASVDKVLSSSHLLDERKIDPKLAVPYPKSRTRKVFVGGLPAELPNSDLREYFGQFGPVDDIELPVDRSTGIRKGFGFISFQTEEAVETAMKKTFHNIGEYTVEVKRAVTKEAQAGGLNSGHRSHVAGGRPVQGHPPTNGHAMVAQPVYSTSPPTAYAAYNGAYPQATQVGYNAVGHMYPYPVSPYAGYPYYAAYQPYAGVAYSQQVPAQQAFTAFTTATPPDAASKYGPVRNSTSTQSGYRPY